MMTNDERLTAQQRSEYVALLGRGVPAAGVCGSLGVSLAAVEQTLAADREFRLAVQGAEAQLSQNVAAALYRKAMEGNVTAQTFLLKHRPPPEWRQTRVNELTDEELAELSDEELAELLRR